MVDRALEYHLDEVYRICNILKLCIFSTQPQINSHMHHRVLYLKNTAENKVEKTP